VGFALFNNDAKARTPANATLLRDLLHSTAHASEAGTEGDGHG
jgi:hypothetical protein